MYGWIWKKLPGSKRAKMLEAAALIIAFVALLFLLVFPIVSQWISELSPSTVDL